MKQLSLCLIILGASLSLVAASPLAPIPTLHTVLTVAADPDHFEFAVAGDNRSTGHGEPMPEALAVICREIGLVRPSFTFWTGDSIEGYSDTVDEANGEYDVFLRAANLTEVPMFSAPGNHEFSLDTKLLPVYEKRMGALYGSFDYGNSHFVAVNTTAVLDDGTLESGSLDPAQWAWLEADLKAHQSSKNIFVFMHHYPFGPVGDDPTLDSGMESAAVRDRFHALMVKYGVRAVFASHDHLYWHAKKDGVDYYVSGGAGAPLDALPTEGGFLHYLIVHVDGNQTSIDIMQPWHLTASYPTGDGQGDTTESAHVANTQGIPVHVGGLDFHVPLAPAGSHYAAVATTAYKKKSKPAEASIVSVTPISGTSQVIVTVAVDCPKSRSTIINLSLVSNGK